MNDKTKNTETDDTEGNSVKAHGGSPVGVSLPTDDTEGNTIRIHPSPVGVSPEGETDDTEGNSARWGG